MNVVAPIGTQLNGITHGGVRKILIISTPALIATWNVATMATSTLIMGANNESDKASVPGDDGTCDCIDAVGIGRCQ